MMMMLTGPTGLHHQDQKLMYKDKERDSKAFLDVAGVKDKSKMVVMEDPIIQEKRYLEMRKNATMEKASKLISQISLEVDRLAGRVSALESVIGKGGKVEEKQVLSLIELLMNELLKLDGIMGDEDVKLQRKLQPSPIDEEQQQQHQEHQEPQQKSRNQSGPVVVTTQWETFDATPSHPLPSSANNNNNNSNSSGSAQNQQPKFPWDFFG
ncbi:BAG family molecular chaperone regulator 1 [Linum grandiflorum]